MVIESGADDLWLNYQANQHDQLARVASGSHQGSGRARTPTWIAPRNIVLCAMSARLAAVIAKGELVVFEARQLVLFGLIGGKRGSQGSERDNSINSLWHSPAEAGLLVNTSLYLVQAHQC